jgi:hypothetical protein
MNWLDRLERRFGFIAIPHLVLSIVLLQALATLMGAQDAKVPLLMMLDPVAVISGQWWRLFTYILVPDVSRLGLIFAIFWFYFLWMMGQALEAQWGAFRLTVYVMSGIVFGALVSMAGYLFLNLDVVQDGTYWTLGLQLAFAYLYPDFEILIFFILPLKMRWVAWIVGAFLLLKMALGGLPEVFVIAGSMGNYLLFFGPLALRRWRERSSSMAAQSAMRSSVREAMSSLPLKSCKACGKGVNEADLRLCLCERCGSDGKFWCVDDLKEHLKN